MFFPYPDMSDDDLEGLPFAHRDFSGDDDRNNEELCSLGNRHLFVHGHRIKEGDKKVLLPAMKDESEQLLLTGGFDETDDIERLDTKPASSLSKKVEIVEEKEEEPDFILVDLDKKE